MYHRYYGTQKKILELNPRHPLVKELKRRVETSKDDQTTKDLAMVLFETATLRSNFLVKDTAAFAGRIERMLRLSMDISLDEKVRPFGFCKLKNLYAFPPVSHSDILIVIQWKCLVFLMSNKKRNNV